MGKMVKKNRKKERIRDGMGTSSQILRREVDDIMQAIRNPTSCF
jgi:hypothetical protein